MSILEGERGEGEGRGGEGRGPREVKGQEGFMAGRLDFVLLDMVSINTYPWMVAREL